MMPYFLTIFWRAAPVARTVSLLNDSPGFIPRFVGMLVAAALMGFVIGGGMGILVFSAMRGFRSEGFPVKKAIQIGGAVGAVAGAAFFSYIVFY